MWLCDLHWLPSLSAPSQALCKPSALFRALSRVFSRHGKYAGHRSCPVCCPLGTVGRQCQAKPPWRACRTDHAHWSAHASRAAHDLGDMPRGACPRDSPAPALLTPQQAQELQDCKAAAQARREALLASAPQSPPAPQGCNPDAQRRDWSFIDQATSCLWTANHVRKAFADGRALPTLHFCRDQALVPAELLEHIA